MVANHIFYPIILIFLSKLIEAQTYISTIQPIRELTISYQEINSISRVFNSGVQYAVGGHHSNSGTSYITKLNLRTENLISTGTISGIFEYQPTRIHLLLNSRCFITGKSASGLFECNTGALIQNYNQGDNIQSSAVVPHTNYLFYLYSDITELHLIDFTTQTRTISTESNIPLQASGNLHRKGSPYYILGGNEKYPNRLDYTTLKIDNYILTELNTYPNSLVPPNSPIGFYFQPWVFKIDEGFSKETILWSSSRGYIYEGNDISGEAIGDHQVGQYNIGRFEKIRGSFFIIYLEVMILNSKVTFPFYQEGNGSLGIFNCEKSENVYRKELTKRNSLSLVIDQLSLKIGYNFVRFNSTFISNPSYRILSVPETNSKIYISDIVKTNFGDPNCQTQSCNKCALFKNFCIDCKDYKRAEKGNCVFECGKDRFYNLELNECLISSCPESYHMEDGECVALCSSERWLEDQSCLKECTEKRVKDKKRTCPVKCGEGGVLNTETRICEYKENQTKNGWDLPDIVRTTALTASWMGAVSSFLNKNLRENSFRLFQLFEFYELLEKDYNPFAKKILTVFGEVGINPINIRIFWDKNERDDGKDDKVNEKLDKNFLRNCDQTLQLFLILNLTSILFFFTKKVYFKKEKINLDDENITSGKGFAKSSTIIFLKKFNTIWVIQILFDFLVDFCIAANQNLVYGINYLYGLFISAFFLLKYFLILFLGILKMKKWDFLDFWTANLKPEISKSKIGRYIDFVFDFSNFFKCLFVIIFRGNIKFQTISILMLQILPFVFWFSTFKFFIYQNKLFTIYKGLREILAFICFFMAAFDNYYTDMTFNICIVGEIVLVMGHFLIETIKQIINGIGFIKRKLLYKKNQVKQKTVYILVIFS